MTLPFCLEHETFELDSHGCRLVRLKPADVLSVAGGEHMVASFNPAGK